MIDDWNLKDKRLLFRSLRNWGCDASCGLYEFDEENQKLIIPKYEEKFTPNNIKELNEWDKQCIDENLYYFYGKDIENLRKKLIDDINKNTEWALMTRIEMIKQINKRFGVEEWM